MGYRTMFKAKYKYPRTYHLPNSPGLQNDDRVHKDPSFFLGKEVVVTLKMDGENANVYPDGTFHARSLDTSYHPSRTFMGKIAADIGWQLPDGWRISGENLYAEHSIHYSNLQSYFYVFAIWDENNRCLAWDRTVEWCKLLELTHVPVLYRGEFGWNKINDIVDRIQNDPQSISPDPIEGFVVRTVDGFDYPNDPKGNSDSFMVNLAKWVRKDHVTTDEHWLNKEVIPNELLNE